jgi:mRNA interferase RelE/StbE
VQVRIIGQIIEDLMASEPYEIQYASEAVADLRAMRPFDRRNILNGIELHLLHQPKFVSKSRIKAMIQPFWSQYRLRIDEFRIYYDVDGNDRVVNVLRVLRKTTARTPEESP